MDPQMKSIVTSLVKDVITAAAVWAVAHGFIQAGQETTVVNDALAVVMFLASQGLTYYKQQQVSPTAIIKTVNETDNGVKVVAASEPAPAVTAPLKGAK